MALPQSVLRSDHPWPNLSLGAQFLALSALVMGTAMAVLGAWVGAHIERGMLTSSASSSAVLMENFLAPMVQSVPETGGIGPTDREELDRIFATTSLHTKMVSVKIWSPAGDILYNSGVTLIPEAAGPERIARAARGDIVVNFEPISDHPELNYAFIEIYAPLYRQGTNEIIAVGEFHEDATDFLEAVGQAQIATWLVVGAVTLTMILLLYIVVRRGSHTIARQQTELERRAADAQKLASQNTDLRLLSEAARKEAGEANEQLLGSIGADLHDGPIQLLSLLIFKLTRLVGKRAPEQTRLWMDPTNFETIVRENIEAFIRLSAQSLEELRSISAGLVLPEIDNLSVSEALELAITRHKELTGTEIAVHFKNLPDPVSAVIKTCLYRVVQEALTNATRYAEGRGQSVWAEGLEDRIAVEISDAGPGIDMSATDGTSTQRLGLLGMRNRVLGLNGTFSVEPRNGFGTAVRVTIPLRTLVSDVN